MTPRFLTGLRLSFAVTDLRDQTRRARVIAQTFALVSPGDGDTTRPGWSLRGTDDDGEGGDSSFSDELPLSG